MWATCSPNSTPATASTWSSSLTRPASSRPDDGGVRAKVLSREVTEPGRRRLHRGLRQNSADSTRPHAPAVARRWGPAGSDQRGADLMSGREPAGVQPAPASPGAKAVAQARAIRILLVALLTALAAAGLRGHIRLHSHAGPDRGDGIAAGAILEAVLAMLMRWPPCRAGSKSGPPGSRWARWPRLRWPPGPPPGSAGSCHLAAPARAAPPPAASAAPRCGQPGDRETRPVHRCHPAARGLRYRPAPAGGAAAEDRHPVRRPDALAVTGAGRRQVAGRQDAGHRWPADRPDPQLGSPAAIDAGHVGQSPAGRRPGWDALGAGGC